MSILQFQHQLPECNLFFGKNTLQKIGQESKRWGKRALLVTGRKSMQRLGFLEEAIECLERERLTSIHYNGVQPNPTVQIVDEGARMAQEKNCDVIVALGGGSAIDTGKAIAVRAAFSNSDSTIWDYISVGEQKACRITSRTLPLVVATSTSGSGSHVTPYAVITNSRTEQKVGFYSKYIFPKASIVDVRLPSKMSADLTASTGFDVLAHATESIIGRGDHPIADIYSLKAMELVKNNLSEVYRNGENVKARSCMALADTLAGLAITIAGTTMGHALVHPLGARYNLPHGLALALVSSAIWRFTIENGDKRTVERYTRIAQKLGEKIAPPPTREKAMRAVKALNKLLETIGLNKSLSDFGVREEDIGTLAEDAMAYMRVDLGRHPTQISRKNLVSVLEESF